MLKVHSVPHKFNHFIVVSEIEDAELKAKIQESLNHVMEDESYIQFQGSFGFVFDMQDESTFEWAVQFKQQLPLSLTAREKTIAILMD